MQFLQFLFLGPSVGRLLLVEIQTTNMSNNITDAKSASNYEGVLPFALNTNQAARYLGVCPKTVFNLRKQYVLPHSRINRRVVFRRSDLDAYLEKNNSHAGVSC